MRPITLPYVLCDTGTLSRYMTEKEKEIETITSIKREYQLCISIVNRIELFNWLSGYRTLNKAVRVKILKKINEFHVIHVNEPISKIALELSNKDLTVKPADLLIGATAFYHAIPLYTLNKKDFIKFGITLI